MSSELLFMVRYSEEAKVHVLVMASDREQAKMRTRKHLRGNADGYVVTPLTKPDEDVIIDMYLLAGGDDE